MAPYRPAPDTGGHEQPGGGPAATGARDPVSGTTAPAAAILAPGGAPMPVRVVVSDDHAMVRRGLVELLSAADGIEVVGEAANGREALDRIAELDPDVVLMDLQMPEMD